MKIVFDSQQQKDKFLEKLRDENYYIFCPDVLDIKINHECCGTINKTTSCDKCWESVIALEVLQDSTK